MDDTRSAADAKPRRLGRGLGSLIAVPVEIATPARVEPAATDPLAPSRSPATPADGPPERTAITRDTSDTVHQLPVAAVRPNRHQPRQQFDDGALDQLAASIRTAGLMQPIVVRPADGGYELIAGERRLRAIQRLGLERIPALVRPIDDRAAAEWALIENLQREDLNPMERARAFKRLIDEFGLAHAELAEHVGVDRSTISNFLRLNDLDDSTAASVERGFLTLGHAKALLGCTDPGARARLAAQVVRLGWSVRQTEARVREMAKLAAAGAAPDGSLRIGRRGSAHLESLERNLGEHLGTRVQIQPGRKKGSGRLVIEYFTLDQFEGVLERLGFEGADGRP